MLKHLKGAGVLLGRVRKGRKVRKVRKAGWGSSRERTAQGSAQSAGGAAGHD